MHKIQVVYSPLIQFIDRNQVFIDFWKKKYERKRKKKKRTLEGWQGYTLVSCDKVFFKAFEHKFVLRIIVRMGTPIVWHSYNGAIDKS